MFNTIAAFMTPEVISVTPLTLLWALPILLFISIVVKAVKPVVFDMGVLVKDSIRLFIGSAVVLVLISIVVGMLLHLVN